MRVLVACEFSGIVRDAFAARGHDAWSCDVLATERPGQHIQCDVLEVLDDGWGLVIAHPPCRYLASSGARWKYEKPGWAEAQAEALLFVEHLWRTPTPRLCIENPVGILPKRSSLGPATQWIQPYQFGHPETKKTGLWMRGLPRLRPTNVVEGREHRVHRESPGPDRWRNRSRTYRGIAEAMAQQWG